ncbi:protocadherin beta-15-like [Indicator indicator]|uniref:protocadherin beta-15-like n=1 Tax=Indicator indicator TaxID=1002788 RepID=UPI0023DE9443|nr:protocadherin beta-15-like [Indicator indicator]
MLLSSINQDQGDNGAKQHHITNIVLALRLGYCVAPCQGSSTRVMAALNSKQSDKVLEDSQRCCFWESSMNILKGVGVFRSCCPLAEVRVSRKRSRAARGLAEAIPDKTGSAWKAALQMPASKEDAVCLLWRAMAWNGRRSRGSLRQVILFLLCVCVWQSGAESLRYSVAEEMERDSFVGNIAQDLGLDPSQLAARKARVVSEGNQQLFRLDWSTGVLTATESLDREEICPQSETCSLFFTLFLDNPLQLIQGEVEVLDVNDNSPMFPEKEMVFEILETTPPGSRFPLDSAQDIDVGSNGLQNYSLGYNAHFSLTLGSAKSGVKYPELVLERQLDREEQPEMKFLLTATDGGSPPRSGTSLIRIVVLDANDNIPMFSRDVYEVSVAENSPPGQLVVRVAATDPDEGSNGKVHYAFTQIPEESRQLFDINPDTGEFRVAGKLDFEETKIHELTVRASDGGGLYTHCKVHVDIVDVNDNAPEIQLTSHTASIPEDAPLRTLVALFSVRDRDSGDNSRTECTVEGDLPFTLTPTFSIFYELRTNAALDRETTAEYNISIRATDWGPRRLSSRQSLWVQVWDVNDNAPAFSQELYSMWVTENNSPMVRIGSVQASDADAGSNARVQYALEREEGQEQPALSVSSESGDVYVVRSLDYERLRALEVWVRAADGGSPALSARALLRVLVRDENDNAPVVLHPGAESSAGAGELVPRWAPAGYLVAKVVAVDADAGQNAWLSYELAKATEPGLFRLGLHSGEVRTARAVAERDAPRHRLVVLVRDRGQPPRSASATLAIALLHDFSDAHLRLSHEAPPAEPDDTLTLYLIACLACVSALCLATGLAALLLKLRRDRRKHAAPLPTFPTAVAESDAGSLPRSLMYDVCLATGSLSSDFHFLGPLLPCLPAGLPPGVAPQRSSVCSQEASDIAQGRNSAAQGVSSTSHFDIISKVVNGAFNCCIWIIDILLTTDTQLPLPAPALRHRCTKTAERAARERQKRKAAELLGGLQKSFAFIPDKHGSAWDAACKCR